MDDSLRPNVAVAPCSHLTIPGDSKEHSDTTHCSAWSGTALVHLCLQYNKKPSELHFVDKGLLLPNSQLKNFTISNAATCFGGVFSSLNWVQKYMDWNLSVNLSWCSTQWLGPKDTQCHLTGIPVSLGFSALLPLRHRKLLATVEALSPEWLTIFILNSQRSGTAFGCFNFFSPWSTKEWQSCAHQR